MKLKRFVLFPILVMCLNVTAEARIEIEIPNEKPIAASFKTNVNNFLTSLEESRAAHLLRLITLLRESDATVSIRAITDDPEANAHTDPTDGKPKNLGRKKPTAAVIFINSDRVDPNHESYRLGMLAHELVHALDLTHGRYHSDYAWRERRAVFIENLWRDLNGFELRDSYHGRFPTTDYQYAKAEGTVAYYANFLFTRNDFPEVE
jgi:hypothetical protein